MSTRSRAAALFLLAGCSLYSSDDDAPGNTDAPVIDAPQPTDTYWIDAQPNAGFTIPVATTKANVNNGGVWTEVGDADWTCLGTPSPDQPSTGTISLSGRITDFQTGNGVGSATVTAWSTSPSATVGTATTSAEASTRGDFTMTLAMLPAGTRRYGFTLAAASYMSTLVIQQYFAPGSPATATLDIMSDATATALPAFIGITRDQTKALYLGEVRDCQGRHVSNAVAAVSVASGTYADAGGTTFYFSAGSTSLPVRHTVSPWINNDGLFTVVNVQPGQPRYVQVWGFRTNAELNAGTMTLLGEMPTPAQADQTVMMRIDPRRT